MEKLVIQSNIDNLIEVERFVSVVCDSYNINNYAATISMSLLAAVENAIVHGNQGDLSRKVTITSDYCTGGVYFAVSDEGVGFDYAAYGKMPEQGSKGTGLYLMCTLSDRIVFSDHGSTVRMEFIVSGIEPSRALERIVRLHNYYAPRLVYA